CARNYVYDGAMGYW
nr:immunoglobulin heavy chain junction region [Mus musculus]